MSLRPHDIGQRLEGGVFPVVPTWGRGRFWHLVGGEWRGRSTPHKAWQDHPAWTSLVSRQSCAPTPCPWPSILPQHLLCPSLLAPPRSVGAPGVLLSRINNGQPPTTAVKVQGSLFSAPCHSRASLGCQASTTCCEHSPAAPPGLAHSTLLPRLHLQLSSGTAPRLPPPSAHTPSSPRTLPWAWSLLLEGAGPPGFGGPRPGGAPHPSIHTGLGKARTNEIKSPSRQRQRGSVSKAPLELTSGPRCRTPRSASHPEATAARPRPGSVRPLPSPRLLRGVPAASDHKGCANATTRPRREKPLLSLEAEPRAPSFLLVRRDPEAQTARVALGSRQAARGAALLRRLSASASKTPREAGRVSEPEASAARSVPPDSGPGRRRLRGSPGCRCVPGGFCTRGSGPAPPRLVPVAARAFLEDFLARLHPGEERARSLAPSSRETLPATLPRCRRGTSIRKRP